MKYKDYLHNPQYQRTYVININHILLSRTLFPLQLLLI